MSVLAAALSRRHNVLCFKTLFDVRFVVKKINVNDFHFVHCNSVILRQISRLI